MDTLGMSELLGTLSLAADLSNGQPGELGLRSCLLATRLVDPGDTALRRDVYWTALLRYLGCQGFAVEEAGFAAGDDIGLRASFLYADVGRPAEMAAAVLRDVGRGAPWPQRLGGIARLLADPGAPRRHALAQCETGVDGARRLGMSPAVAAALAQTDERFDGRGLPLGLAGAALHPAIRHVEVARVAVLFFGRGGLPAACAELQRRAGGHLDPALVRRFVAAAPVLCDGLAQASVWDEFIAIEPGCWRLPVAELNPLLQVFASFADMRSGYLAGHSPAVAGWAVAAAREAGLGADDQALLQGAALLHDLGRVSVPTGLWDKPGPLNLAEWERVRLHSHFTERVLRRSPALARHADIAGRCHERLDGSGYPRGDGPSALTPLARLLAAADVWQACQEDRAYRKALPAAAAEQVLRRDVAEGRLCRHAVDAVLAAAGRGGPAPPGAAPATDPSTRTGAAPAADPSARLSAREREVLRLLVRGLSNKLIARELGISPRTVQQHTVNLYAKTGMKSRAGAALYALQQGLLP